MKKLFVLPVLVALGTGCEELEDFLPTVAFDTLQVQEIDFENAKVDFVFAVDNPNPVEVGLSSFSYDLGLEQVPLLSGDNEEGFVLEAADASELRLPVDLSWASTWDTVQATRGLDTVGFGLDGHFGFETPVGEARLPYAEQGGFPALRTPKFRFKNARVANLNLTSADIEVDLGIDNEHGSTLFFDRFDYALTLQGQPIADGLINTFDVDPDQEGNLTLPVSVNLLTAGASIVGAITNGGPVDLGIGANMDVQTPFNDFDGNPVIVPLGINERGDVNLSL